MADDLSPEERMKLVCEINAQAPPGQFSHVFNGTRILLDDDGILKTGVKSFLQYHIDQMTSVDIEEERVVLSQEGVAGGGGAFLAPNSNKLFSFDPLRQEANVVGDAEARSSQDEARRICMKEELKKYLGEHYQNSASTVYARTTDDSECVITVLIEAHDHQTRNYFTGNWRSLWTVTVDASGASAEVKGTVKVQVHYYEDGNVQLLTSKSSSSSITFDSDEGLAKSVCKLIGSVEGSFQKSITETYSKFQTETFKSLRRALPLTHSKMNWDQIASYKIGSELKSQ